MARMPRASARAAASVIASASATELASGFSQRTCLPASSAAIAISAWVSPGVTMSTTSTSSRAIVVRQSVDDSDHPHFAAAAAVEAASRPVTTCMTGSRGRSKNLGATLQPCEWAAPMKPWPIIAIRSVSVMSVSSRRWWGAHAPGAPVDDHSNERSMYWSTLSFVTTGASRTIRFGMPGVMMSPSVLFWAIRRARATPSAAWVDG
ncbi:hypothetical protein QE428_001711 [Microbacterium sp. SORGH_AS 505]|nr:hypothetical protein [Microbacterium sp. SORGH_AS_0505]